MTIDRFLRSARWTEARLALEVRKTAPDLSTSQATIHRLRRRGQKASAEVAIAIELATDGKVRAEEVPMARVTRWALAQLRSTRPAA